MRYVLGLRCINCGQELPAGPRMYFCPDCGAERGMLDVEYEYSALAKAVTRERLGLSRDYTIFRYLSFLPVNPGAPRPNLRVGWTPLYKTRILAEKMGMEHLYVKDEGCNPTGTIKDRAAVIGVIKAIEGKSQAVSCASTGDAATALASFAAALELHTYIFMPASSSQSVQALLFGAKVFSVEGTYQETYTLADNAAKQYGWYNCSAIVNPYLVEGKKTVAMEIAEQLDWQVPDWVVLPFGDGSAIVGVWKGFNEMLLAGLIDKLPRLAGVQTDGQAIAQTPVGSIAPGDSRNRHKALQALHQSNGVVTTVGGTEALQAARTLAQTTGVLAEAGSASALRGLEKLLALGTISPNNRVVMISTGRQVPDVQTGLQPAVIKPDLAALVELVQRDSILQM